MQFRSLSRSAQAYLLAVYALAAVLAAVQFLEGGGLSSLTGSRHVAEWWPFAFLVVAAAAAHSFPVSTADRQAYHVSPPFFMAAVILLEPLQLTALMVVVHVAERLRKRRSWFAQLFNTAAYTLTAAAAHGVYRALSAAASSSTAPLIEPLTITAGIAAVLTFMVMNHGLVSLAVWMGNGIPPHRQHLLEPEPLVTEALLLSMGLPLAHLAHTTPWSLPLAAAPLLLIHRALDLPNVRAQRRRDGLTDLYSSQYLTEACSRELDRADRFGRPLAVLVIDLDKLGTINNTFGTQAGDAVIRGTARILERALRGYDLAARTTGGRFEVLLPEIDSARAIDVANRVRTTIAAFPHELESSLEPVKATVSIGISCSTGRDDTPERLFGAARAALIQAKRAGGDRVQPFTGLWTGEASQTAPTREATREAASPAAPAEGGDRSEAALPSARRPGGSESTTQKVNLLPPASEGAAARGWAALATPLVTRYSKQTLFTLQAVVTVASASVCLLVAPAVPSVDPVTALLFASMVAVAELRSFELFGSSSFAITVVPHIAAGILLGPAGAVVVAPVGAIVRGLRRRSRWYKVLFNVNVYLLAATGAAAIFRYTAPPLGAPNLFILLVPAALAGLAYYLHTAVVAAAMGAELRTHPVHVWTDQFRWLWPHYVALSVMGLLLALAYHEFGLAGAAVFLVPPLMMNFVAKQYISRTLVNVRQLRSLNDQLQAEVTQRKTAEEENARLAEAAARTAALEELNRLKSEFISVASHELRTPMTAIMGFTELLLDDAPPEDPNRETLSIVHEEAVHLSALVDNLLDVSRIENGRITLEPMPIDLSDTVLPPLLHALGSSSPNHQLVADISPDARWVQADQTKLNQILTNLVSNAIKYSPDGGKVEITARRDGDMVAFAVRDEGIGVPPEHLERIFDRFYRVDSSETRSIGGTGLGLYITRHLVELHGGALWAESEIGKGSTFHFHLPAAELMRETELEITLPPAQAQPELPAVVTAPQ